MELEARTHVVTYSHNEVLGNYTFSLLEKGGPIVTANSIEEGKAKFDTMMHVAISARNLLYVDGAIHLRNVLLRNKRDSKREYDFKEVA